MSGSHTTFDEKRAAQIAAYFLQKANGGMPLLKLMKLMYLADRRSIQLHGHPITFDRMVSMDHGPVLSTTLNLANGSIETGPDGWDAWISDRSGHNIALNHQFTRDDLDDLSNADLAVLDDVWETVGHLNKWQIRDYTHQNCPEWRDPHGSSIAISMEDILTAVGQSEMNATQQAVALRDLARIEGKLR
jgi:uncharacterized phage-associated protein